MTSDEMETRIFRLEMRLDATQALIRSVLPATLPASRHQVLNQFRRWCAATEDRAVADGLSTAQLHWHLSDMASMYESLKTSIDMIEAYEAKKSD